MSTNFVGRVSSINDLAIQIEFEGKAPSPWTLLELASEPETKLLVLAILAPKKLICLSLDGATTAAFGQVVRTSKNAIQIPVGQTTLGRVYNGLGQPVDGKKVASSQAYIELKPFQRKGKSGYGLSTDLIETGIKVIDFFAPFVRGRKIGIVGGAGVGKTVLTTELMHNVCSMNLGVSMFVGIGERIREAHELYDSLQQSQLLKNTVLFLGQMNESAIMRSLAGLSSVAAARYFRDFDKKDVLFFVDNIYRYLQAGNELSTMLGETSIEAGYQPTMVSDLLKFEEALDSNENASITSVQSIYIPADDLSDPAVVEIYQQLDSVIVLSREVMESGILPAVDLVNTVSSMLTPEVVGERHYFLAARAQAILQKYYSLKGIITIIGESELSVTDRVDYNKAKQLIDFFTQSLFVTEPLTGKKGQYISRDNTLSGVEEILTSS